MQKRYVPLPDWYALSGMRKTKTYEWLGLKRLRAIKVGKRVLIDLPHGLKALASMPRANIRPPKRRLRNRDAAASP